MGSSDVEGHGSCGIGSEVEGLKEGSVEGEDSDMRALEAKVSGRVAIEGSGVWAGLAAREEALAKGFEAANGFGAPVEEKGFVGPVEVKGFVVPLLEVGPPPNNWAPMFCGCAAGSGSFAGICAEGFV